MFLDTSFNSLNTVLSNIYSAFLETALKTYTYARCLPSNKQPGTQFFIRSSQAFPPLSKLMLRHNRDHHRLDRVSICFDEKQKQEEGQ
jgi:hypothetical protein